MTDAELSRQEWIEERIAIMVESGVPEDQATHHVERMWERHETDIRAAMAREHAPASHGDGAGARESHADKPT